MTNPTSDRTPKPLIGYLWFLATGAVAGICFNLAFGSVAWSVEGITGGMASALLIYAMS
ncbi:MAG: hypothetical protein WCO26_03740 [Deltaproteobacteria bacterium]